MSELQERLRELRACEEAVVWVGERDLKRAWKECQRGDWMLWLCGEMLGKPGWPTRQEIVLAACCCAELALPIFEKKYPKDDRPRKAIETTRLWARGKATIEEVRSAAYAAYAAYAAADAADAAAAAADAAADAADAAYAAAAADAAYAAADAAAYAAARAKTLRKCADICRKQLSIPKE